MRLNLPIHEVTTCKNLLIAGMGGGFDLFCGLPIYFELRQRGQTVHLASFSFSEIVDYKGGIRLTDTLVGVTANYEGVAIYFPELYLSQWFKAQRGETVTIWSFQKTGARPLLANYRVLVEHLSIDGIVLIDGGVDSLMCGDEAEMGTPIEDATSLLAVSALDHVPVRLIGCLGFGAERDITYAHVLENVAALAAEGGFLGACALVREMESYQLYEDAVLYTQGKRFQDPSVINSSIISAVRGHYGDYHLTDKTRNSRLWISPLMTLYWFFDLGAVVARNLYIDRLRETNTFMDGAHALLEVRRLLPKRPTSRIPLT